MYTAPKTFKVATWNMAGGAPYKPTHDEIKQTTAKVLGSGVSILLLNECYSPGYLESVVSQSKYARSYKAADQCAVVWLTNQWTSLGQEAVSLSKTPFYFSSKNGKPKFVVGASVLLADKAGRTLDALSYHLPPNVQAGPGRTPNPLVPRRVAALRESMVVLAERNKTNQARAFLAGGDDNVDESIGSGWEFMLKRATGLSLVQSPVGTFGSGEGKPKGWKIDDFRTSNLVASNRHIVSNTGDHAVFVSDMTWV